MACNVSVILVSDYRPGEEKSWQDMRAALRALAQQDFGGSFEVLLVEEARFVDAVPSDLREILPQLRIVPSTETNSYALANVGVAAADSPYVILLDADCVPTKGWMRVCTGILAADPGIGVVSGVTRYPGRSLTERCLSLLSRSFVDPGRRGATRHISNNNAGYRREAYLRHPLPTKSGIYASRLQAVAMERGGWRLTFEPEMAVVHDFEGWDMERDIRRSMAHGLVLVRQQNPALPYAWIIRLGLAGVPLFFAGRLLQQWGKCLTVAARHGLRPWQVPYAMLLAIRSSLMEIPGAVRALRGLPIDRTVYR